LAVARVARGDVFLMALNPTRGSEIRKTRPCVVVSPDELNAHLRTYVVAPLTTGSFRYPFRVACTFQGKAGHVVLDQIRAVDRDRLVKRLGMLSSQALGQALAVLRVDTRSTAENDSLAAQNDGSWESRIVTDPRRENRIEPGYLRVP